MMVYCPNILIVGAWVEVKRSLLNRDLKHCTGEDTDIEQLIRKISNLGMQKRNVIL